MYKYGSFRIDAYVINDCYYVKYLSPSTCLISSVKHRFAEKISYRFTRNVHALLLNLALTFDFLCLLMQVTTVSATFFYFLFLLFYFLLSSTSCVGVVLRSVAITEWSPPHQFLIFSEGIVFK